MLSGTLSCTGGTQNRKSAEWTDLIANFRVFWPDFRVHSVGKAYRKAIIKYLRENNAKKGKEIASSCCKNDTDDGPDKGVRPPLLTSSRQVIFRFYLII